MYIKPSQRNHSCARAITGNLNNQADKDTSKGGEKQAGTGISIQYFI